MFGCLFVMNYIVLLIKFPEDSEYLKHYIGVFELVIIVWHFKTIKEWCVNMYNTHLKTPIKSNSHNDSHNDSHNNECLYICRNCNSYYTKSLGCKCE